MLIKRSQLHAIISASRLHLLTFGVRCGGAAASFIANAAVIRLLGTDEAGLFAIGYAMVSICSIICLAGFENLVLRSASVAHAQKDYALANSTFAAGSRSAIFLSAFLLAVLLTTADWIGQNVFKNALLAPTIRAMAPAIGFVSLCILCSKSLQGLRYTNTSSAFPFLIQSALFIVLMALFPPSKSFHASQLFTVASALSLLVAFAIRSRVNVRGHSTINWRSLFHSSISLWIVSTCGIAIRSGPILVGGIFLASSEIAELAISQRLAAIAMIAMSATTQHAAPMFASAWKEKDFKTIQKVFLLSSLTAAALASPILVPCLLVPEFVLSAVSPELESAATLLRIAAVGYIIVVLTGPLMFLLSMCEQDAAMRNVTLISALSGLSLNAVLAWRFGAIGAACGMNLVIILNRLFIAWQVKAKLGFWPGLASATQPRISETP